MIQVCTNLDTQETLQREVRTLLAAAEQYPHASLNLVTTAMGQHANYL